VKRPSATTRPTAMAKPSKDDQLEQVWAILTNPKRSIRSIQAVAAEHGFNDLEEFNRLFEKRYGNSPVVARKAVRKGRARLGPRG
jgi:AraC-like DNA-binding protein